jgi:hypothetical protein
MLSFTSTEKCLDQLCIGVFESKTKAIRITINPLLFDFVQACPDREGQCIQTVTDFVRKEAFTV